MKDLVVSSISKNQMSAVSFIGETAACKRPRSLTKDSLTTKESSCLEDTKAFVVSMAKAFISASKAVWEWVLENIFCQKEPLEKRAQKAEEAAAKSHEDWRLAREKFEKVGKECEKKWESSLYQFGAAKAIQEVLKKPHTKNSIYSLIDDSSFSLEQKAQFKRDYGESPRRLHKALQGYVVLGEFLIPERQVIIYKHFLCLTPSPTAFEATVAFSHLLPSSREILIREVGKKEKDVRGDKDFIEFLSRKNGVQQIADICKHYVSKRMDEIERTS